MLHPIHRACYLGYCLLNLFCFAGCKEPAAKERVRESYVAPPQQLIKSVGPQKEAAPKKGDNNDDTGQVLIYEGMLIQQ